MLDAMPSSNLKPENEGGSSQGGSVWGGGEEGLYASRSTSPALWRSRPPPSLLSLPLTNLCCR